MAKNKHIDLFKEIIPSVDQGLKELWDAAGDEGQKEIKRDLWNLVRYISSVSSNNRDIQEHFVLTVNEFYNKNWSSISKHPKLQWFTLCMCAHESRKTQFHEWIPLKREHDKKTRLLLELFPHMKMSDIETLSAITTKEEIKKHCESLGWDKKEINGIKL